MLAVAAKPRLGQTGFMLISIAALLSTASAINATLFGSARLAMVMANEHALPRIFSMRERIRPIPYVGLLALTAAALAFTLTANLEVISTLASATFLLIFAAVDLAALKLARRIGLRPLLPLAGSILSAASFAILVWHAWSADRASVGWLAGFYGIAILAEAGLVLRRGARRAPPGPLGEPPAARPETK